MANKEEQLTRNTYSECLSGHALMWLKNYQQLNSVQYLEQNGGVIISHFINLYGIAKVLTDLDQKIENVLN